MIDIVKKRTVILCGDGLARNKQLVIIVGNDKMSAARGRNLLFE